MAPAKSRKFWFEIKTKFSENLAFSGLTGSKNSAILTAKELQLSPETDAVTVDLVECDPSGFVRRTATVLDLAANTGAESFAVDDTAGMCRDYQEFFQFPARQSINRFFREYLDESELTACEALTDYNALNQALDHDSMVKSAVETLARLWASSPEEAGVMRERFWAMIDTLLEVSRVRPTLPVEWSLANPFETLEMEESGGSAIALSSVIAAELSKAPNFWSKFVRLIGWADKTGSGFATSVIDRFLADCLCNASVLDNLLGSHQERSTKLLMMADLATGRIGGNKEDTGPDDSPKALRQVLDRMISGGMLPQTRACLLHQLQGELTATDRFVRWSKDGEEKAVLGQIIAKLSNCLTLAGGAGMAEAIVRCLGLLEDVKTERGVPHGATLMQNMLLPPEQEASILFALMGSKGNADRRKALLPALRRFFGVIGGFEKIFAPPQSPREVIIRARAFQVGLFATALPRSLKHQLSDVIDKRLSDHITDLEFAVFSDDDGNTVRSKANAMVDLCDRNLYSPTGEAHATISGKVTSLLSTPSFMEAYAKDVADKDERSAILRDLKIRLAAMAD